MEKFKLYNTNNQQKYIKIKIINLGVVASSDTIKSSLFNDVQIFNIVFEKDINEESLKHFINSSDIVFVAADLNDDFVMKNILKIVNVLTHHEKLFTTILGNVDTLQVDIEMMLKDIRHKSSLFIVENQDDISIKNEVTKAQKIKNIIYALCDVIDVKIEEVRVHETMLSSLISLNSFFGVKCELYLYVDYTEEQARREVKQNLKLGSLLKESNQIWIRYPFIKVNQISHNKISNFIDFFESQIDEDAACFLSPKIHSNKCTGKTKVTVLISVSKNMKNSI